MTAQELASAIEEVGERVATGRPYQVAFSSAKRVDLLAAVLRVLRRYEATGAP